MLSPADISERIFLPSVYGVADNRETVEPCVCEHCWDGVSEPSEAQ